MAHRIRVGVVGLGHNGLSHIEAHQALGRSEVVALCDTNSERLEQAGRQFGVEALYADDSFYSHPGLEAISINTGDAFHLQPFLKALAAGKHVLIEKPLGNGEDEVAAMAEAARAADPSLKIQVGYILRFNPVFEAIAALSHSGSLGDIYYMEADYIHNLLYQADQTDPVTGKNWYLDEEIPMVGGGSHPLDILRFISGKQVSSVWTYANHVAFPAMRHDDCQVSLFRFTDGSIAKVAALYAPRCEMAPFYNLRIYGTKGTVERDSVALSQGPEDVHPTFSPVHSGRVSGHPYDPEIADWLDAIEQDRPPRCPLLDGANSTLATLCAVRAASLRREVSVPVLE